MLQPSVKEWRKEGVEGGWAGGGRGWREDGNG